MMLAVLIGDFTLIVGFAVLLLPIVVPELSRPRDATWGALVLLLGLLLITSSDRLVVPFLIVVVGATLLIARLGSEVGLSRWNQLSNDEKLLLRSFQRWTKSMKEFFATFSKLGGKFVGLFKVVIPKPKPRIPKKKWVRKGNSPGQTPLDQPEPLSHEKLHESIDKNQENNSTAASKTHSSESSS